MQIEKMLRRYKNWLASLIITVLIGLSLWGLQGLILSVSSAQADLFDAVWETVNDNFYDPNFNGLDWAEVRGHAGQRR